MKKLILMLFILVSLNILQVRATPALTIKFLQGLDEKFRPSDILISAIPNYIKNGDQYLADLYAGKTTKIPTGPKVTLSELEAVEAAAKSKNATQQAKDKAIATKQKFDDMQKEYLNSIISIVWSLFNKAIEKNQGFTSATTVVKDPGYKLYNFLLEYAKSVNPGLEVGGNPTLAVASLNCYAYRRRSTHFPEQQKLSTFDGHFGIDIRYDEGDLEALLPANKRHVLFGKIIQSGQELTFVKAEEDGVCYRDAVAHLGSLIKKKTVGKVYAPGEIARREDVPSSVKDQFKALKESVKKNDPKLYKELKKSLADHVGIKEIYLETQSLAAMVGAKFATEANKLLQDLTSKYDNLDIRRGNEVILQLP